MYEKSVGTTELQYSTKKREHCFSIPIIYLKYLVCILLDGIFQPCSS